MSAPETTAKQANMLLAIEYNRLRRAAADEANLAVEAGRRRRPYKYWPSRMNQKAIDHLNDVFRAAWPAAIETRFAQLDRINRKLTRSDPEWAPKTPEQIREAPVLLWRGQ